MNTVLLLSMLIGLSVLIYTIYNLHQKFIKYQSNQIDKTQYLETENETLKDDIQILQSKIKELETDIKNDTQKDDIQILQSKILELETDNQYQSLKDDIQILHSKILELETDTEKKYSKLEASLESQKIYLTTQQFKIENENDILKNDIEILHNKIKELEIDTENKITTGKNSMIVLPPTPPKEEEFLSQLIKSYKSNPYNLVEKAIKIRMTEGTKNNIIDGILSNNILFEEHGTGDYFIISNNTGEFYLFFNPVSIFNAHILQIINKSKLFICHGDFLNKTLKGENIPLIKPATVTRYKDNSRKWVLIKSGEINLS